MTAFQFQFLPTEGGKLTKDGFENATREIEIGKPDDSGYVEIGFMDYSDEPVGWVEVEKIPLRVLAEYLRVYGDKK